jgi:uncharacterized protein (DUF302 family)
MLQNACSYGRSVAVDLPFARAIDAAKDALKDEGFGVLCEIDVAKTLKEKIAAAVEPYVILGACNPNLAYQALQREPNLGLLLPCSVVVRQFNGSTIVSAIDAQKMLSIAGNSDLEAVAHEVNRRLGSVLDKLDAMPV